MDEDNPATLSSSILTSPSPNRPTTLQPSLISPSSGSFGTYPRALFPHLQSYQLAAESSPDRFIRHEYPKLLDSARAAVAQIVHAPVAECVFVPNASTGINTVLRNLVFTPGDHIVYFSTVYGAVEKTIAYLTETTPVKGVKVEYTFPVGDRELVEGFNKKVDEVEGKGGKVKVAIFDTVVSMPGVRMPFEQLVKECKNRGVLSCVDGAHGVGHLELNLRDLDADFFVSNCHKYACCLSSPLHHTTPLSPKLLHRVV